MNKKVIVITGASFGMGKDTAKDLINLGHKVYCLSRNIKEMEELKKLGGIVRKLDVSNEKEIEKVSKEILKKEKKIDVLWNNAGFGLYGPLEEIPINDARYQFEVNLFGLAKLTQMILPNMRKNKNGIIINTSSIGGKIYGPLGGWYYSTKHALEGWSDCLRLEVKDFGIDVVILEPGLIDTNFSSPVKKNLKKYRNGIYKKLVRGFEKIGEGAFKSGKSTSTKLISNVIIKIINTKKGKLKTRYYTGKFAFTMLFLRKWLSDKMFDKIILSWMRSLAKNEKK